MDYFLLYLLAIATNIQMTLVLSSLALCGFGLFAILVGTVEQEPRILQTGKKLLAGFAILATLGTLTPSSEKLAFILGGKLVLDAGRSPEAQEISSLLLNKIKESLRSR